MTNMEIPRIKISDSLKNNITVFKFSGFWAPDKKILQSRLYRIYAVITITTLFYLYTLSHMMDVIISMGNLEKVSKGSFLLLTLIAEIFKSLPMLLKQEPLQDLLDALDHDVFQPKNLEQLTIIKDGKTTIKYMFRTFMCMYETTVTLWALFPLFDRRNKISLPLSGWYPYSTENSPAFELTYLYQIFGCVYLACLNCSLDIFIAGLMVNAISQLDIILYKLQYGLDDEKDIEKLEGDELNKMIEKNMEFLKNCAIHYEHITSYVENMEKIFTFSILAQFSASGLIICITMFHMTLVNPISVEFLSMLIYQSCMLMQLFLYCWFGNEILLKSGKIAEAAYMSEWYNRGVKYCRSLQLIMVRSKKPIRLTAGYFFTLSIETFSKILRSAWSYFALLQRVHSKEI